MAATCPKCSFVGENEFSCERCGAVYSKFKSTPQKPAEKPIPTFDGPIKPPIEYLYIMHGKNLRVDFFGFILAIPLGLELHWIPTSEKALRTFIASPLHELCYFFGTAFERQFHSPAYPLLGILAGLDLMLFWEGIKGILHKKFTPFLIAGILALATAYLGAVAFLLPENTAHCDIRSLPTDGLIACSALLVMSFHYRFRDDVLNTWYIRLRFLILVAGVYILSTPYIDTGAAVGTAAETLGAKCDLSAQALTDRSLQIGNYFIGFIFAHYLWVILFKSRFKET